ncbi:MAG: type IV toxin-antitoxin system AbiEi family antitoxin domain-containing protein, partial [Solirubrobacterales bacterium]
MGFVSPVANVQFGVISRRQLLNLGIDSATIHRYLTAGYLIQLHRGAYAVGHTAITPRARWLAAVLASGPNACLSHRSAAALWDLSHPCLPIEVIRSSGGTPPGKVLMHRTRRLPPEQTTAVDGIAVTSVARTLVDLAGVVSPRGLEDAYSVARRRKLVDAREIFRIVDQA